MSTVVAPSAESPIERAVRVVGSQSELARRIGSTQGSVWRWLNGTAVPAEVALAIERETGVSKHDLRPDIYPRDECTPPGAALDTAARHRAPPRASELDAA